MKDDDFFVWVKYTTGQFDMGYPGPTAAMYALAPILIPYFAA